MRSGVARTIQDGFGQVGRLDEISYGPKREFRPPSRRWLAVTGVAGLAATGVVLAVTGTGGHRAVRQPPPATARGGPSLTQTSLPEIVVAQVRGNDVLIVNGPGVLPPSFPGVVVLQVIRDTGRS